MKKVALLASILLLSQSISSQEKSFIPLKKTQKSYLSLDYLSVKMPIDLDGNPEVDMGITGIHYNLLLSKSFYTGLGFYGSIHGKRGGMFTLGINAGFTTKLTSSLFLDTGLHIGGGGGASTPDGGGAFIVPHINIGYDFTSFSTTLGYSYINFFDKGNIHSSQLRLGVQIPLSFNYASFKDRETQLQTSALQKSPWNIFSKKIALMMHLNSLSPYGASQFTDGTSLQGKTIRLAGFEFDTYLTDNWFAFFKADGAFHGIRGGYMDIFIGGGYHFSMNKNRTNILTKFGIGAGGGGGADTGGGFLLYPDISIEQKLYNAVYLSINKGYLASPNQHFTSSTFGVGLKYYVNHSGVKGKEASTQTKFKGLEVIVGQEMYVDAKRMSEPTENLHQIGLQFNVFLTKQWYLAGYTSFANFGNAGAYAEGIVGFGYQSKPILGNKLELFSQILAGAAGGGSISTGQGLIVKPSLGLNYKLNDRLKIRTSIGKVKAKEGALNSTSISLGVNYSLSFLTAN